MIKVLEKQLAHRIISIDLAGFDRVIDIPDDAVEWYSKQLSIAMQDYRNEPIPLFLVSLTTFYDRWIAVFQNR